MGPSITRRAQNGVLVLSHWLTTLAAWKLGLIFAFRRARVRRYIAADEEVPLYLEGSRAVRAVLNSTSEISARLRTTYERSVDHMLF